MESITRKFLYYINRVYGTESKGNKKNKKMIYKVLNITYCIFNIFKFKYIYYITILQSHIKIKQLLVVLQKVIC